MASGVFFLLFAVVTVLAKPNNYLLPINGYPIAGEGTQGAPAISFGRAPLVALATFFKCKKCVCCDVLGQTQMAINGNPSVCCASNCPGCAPVQPGPSGPGSMTGKPQASIYIPLGTVKPGNQFSFPLYPDGPSGTQGESSTQYPQTPAPSGCGTACRPCGCRPACTTAPPRQPCTTTTMTTTTTTITTTPCPTAPPCNPCPEPCSTTCSCPCEPCPPEVPIFPSDIEGNPTAPSNPGSQGSPQTYPPNTYSSPNFYPTTTEGGSSEFSANQTPGQYGGYPTQPSKNSVATISAVSALMVVGIAMVFSI